MLSRIQPFFTELKKRKALVWILSASLFPFMNGLLSWLFTGSPLFMDSIFTALAAAVFGPWQGLLTALLTNAFHEVFRGFPGIHLPFSFCGMATALIVWAFSRPGKIWPPLAISLCLVAVSLANAILGSLITTLVFGGGIGVKIDNLAAGFALITDSDLFAAFLARVPINLVDKAIAVIPSLALAFSLDRPRRQA